MKYKIFILLAVATAFFVSPHAQATPPGSGWTMTFDVEFNTMPQIAHSTSTPTPGLLPCDSWNSRSYHIEQQYYCFPGIDAYNPFSISTGSEGIKCLNITLTKTPSNMNANGQPFVSGMMSTAGGSPYSGEVRSTTPFYQKYGYFEMRAKLPTNQGTGYWSGFFLLPYNSANPGLNSTATEYDVFEAIGNHPTSLSNTIHWNNYANVSTTGYSGVNVATGFHTYGFQWDSANVRWYVDGVLSKTFANQWNDAMYVLWGQAMGGVWPGMADATTITPGSMQIEYVRAYANGSVSTSSPTGTGTASQTISNFPATLNLSTTQSPYTLQGTTSVGLPITYTVASGPATVSGTALTLTGAGTIVLKAANAGNTTYAAVSSTETLTVTAPTQAQTIANFPSTLSLTTADTPHTLPAITSAGLTIAYSVTSGPATVSGNTLKITGAGTVVLKATQAGNSSYSAVSMTETITVKSATATLVVQTIPNFPATLSLTTDDSPYSLTLNSSGNLAVYYTVVSGPATVSGNTLRLTGAGTVVVSGTQAGNGTYASVTARETITITTPPVATKIVQTIFNFPATLTLTTASTPYALRSTTSAGMTITYTVPSGPATVSGSTLNLNGTAGTVVLKATQAGNSIYAPLSVTQTIIVTQPLWTQTLASFPATATISLTNHTVNYSGASSAGLPVTYAVASGPATISGTTLTLTNAGTVVVKATQLGDPYNAAFTMTETITVTKPLWAQTLANFPATATMPLSTPTVTYPTVSSAGLNVKYAVVSGPATISGTTLKLTNTGTVVVRATQSGDPYNAAFTMTETITVTASRATQLAAAATTTTSTTPTVTLAMNSPTFVLAAKSAAGLPITYSIVSGPATITGNAITATGTGTVVVMAVQGNDVTTQTIEVTPAVTKTFAQWEALPGHFTSAQMLKVTITGPTATPQSDGVANLFKYLYNIDPSGRMTAADLAAMPVTETDTTTTPGTTYLTLTYRSYASLTGIKVNVQVSKNLQSWTTVVPDITRQVANDPVTGDPIMEALVNTKGATSEFIRLQVTTP